MVPHALLRLLVVVGNGAQLNLIVPLSIEQVKHDFAIHIPTPDMQKSC
jgi:hypothetical protein